MFILFTLFSLSASFLFNPTNLNSLPDYPYGSMWVNTNTDNAFISVDDTLNNAKWKSITGEDVSGMLTSPKSGVILQANSLVPVPWGNINENSILHKIGNNLLVPLDGTYLISYALTISSFNIPDTGFTRIYSYITINDAITDCKILTSTQNVHDDMFGVPSQAISHTCILHLDKNQQVGAAVQTSENGWIISGNVGTFSVVKL